MSFTNRNFCKSFTLTLNGNTQALATQECSEVIVSSSDAVTYYDYRNPGVGFLVPANTIFTFRGLTDSNQLSANGTSNKVVYYRTQYFTSLTDTR